MQNKTIGKFITNSIILFSIDCGSPYLILPHNPINDDPRLNKRSRYTFDPLPDSIYVNPGYYVSTITTPFSLPQLLGENYDDPYTIRTIMSDNPFCGRITMGYCYSLNDEIRFLKKDVILLRLFH